MKELLLFILKGITGTDIEVAENVQEGGRFEYVIKSPKEMMGIIIGKSGNTIKAIRNLMKVKATLDKVSVNIFAEEV